MGGAQSMLFELYHAIQHYYSSLYNQRVISFENRPTDKNFVSSYHVPYEFVKKDQKGIDSKIQSSPNTVVLYHKLASSDCSILSMLKQRKIPVIVINHTLYNSRGWARIDSKNCDVLVGVSHHMVENLKKWFPLVGRYVCIHNGVNNFRYDPIPSPYVNREEIITGRINRICAWKHSERWIQWVKDVQLPRKMVHDYIGGSLIRSQNNKSVQKIITGSNNIVRMLGNISGFDEKVSIIKTWDLFLYETNREEGISMAILESLCCGVPVICSNHFGNKEVIEEGINGHVFGDREQARKLLKALCCFPERLSKLKETTKSHFDQFLDAKHTASKYIDLIKTLV
jgi:glycosyltransferase involved in cell wall biosynthesis